MSNQKIMSGDELRKLGVDLRRPGSVETLEEFRKYLPLIVIAENLKSLTYSEGGQNVILQKGLNYVMDIRQYAHMYLNKNNDRLLKPADVQFKEMYRPYFGQDLTDKKLFVWGTGGYGDLLFIQPNLIYLKEKYPSCKIFFTTKNPHQLIVKNWDCIDKVVDGPFDYNFLIDTDFHVFLQDIIPVVQQANHENIYSLFSKWFGLNLPDKLLIPKLKPDQEALNKCKEVLNNRNLKEKSFIIVQLGASSLNRTPSSTVWKKLIDVLTENGHRIIISGHPELAQNIDIFIKTLNNQQNIFNFLHYSNNILDAIAMTSLSKFAISPDSALIHIAEALGIKSFGIYGAFPGKLRLSTYKNCDWIDCKADCAPCFTHEYSLCTNVIDNYPACYDNLNIQEAIYKISRNLNENIVSP